jgi:hypothetical protein
MLTFFWICAGVGIILVLLSLFGLGGDHDFDHDFDHSFDSNSGADSADDSVPSLLSYRVIISFMTAFGVGGVLAMKLGGWSPFWSAVTGVLAGVVVAIIVWGILKVAFSQQASSTISIQDCVGLQATVTIQILPGQAGEVSVVLKGQSRCFMATADNIVCPEGATVKINEVIAGTLKVELVS